MVRCRTVIRLPPSHETVQAGFPNDAFVVAGLIAAHGRTGDTAGAQAVWDEASNSSSLRRTTDDCPLHTSSAHAFNTMNSL